MINIASSFGQKCDNDEHIEPLVDENQIVFEGDESKANRASNIFFAFSNNATCYAQTSFHWFIGKLKIAKNAVTHALRLIPYSFLVF